MGTFPTKTMAILAAQQKVLARPRLRHAFFRKLRSLTLGGYYTHSSTWKSLGYIGSMPIGGAYPGVPEEIIKRLGLEDL
jgi:hypothetical protein